mmetsp:Transcript_65742/g.185053  ORF Transcript_65742/g.185053 Transcript_65742/m.185053 type:complete len:219 (-) Transcript_65742:2-658(-)
MVLSGNLNLAATSGCRNTPQFSFGGRPGESKKEPLPGPGKYDSVAVEQDKFRRHASWSMPPGRSRSTTFKCPGPGAYQSPAPGSAASQKWSFGSAPQRPKIADRKMPGPGHYEVRCDLDNPTSLIRSRLETRPSSTTPGPGTHNPSHDQVEATHPKFKFGSSTRSGYLLRKGPGPGDYESPALAITKRSGHRITMQGRYPEPTTGTKGPDFVSATSTF